MLSKALLTASAALYLAVTSDAEGLYSKNSAVLQVNAKNYDKLVAKSNQVSVRPNSSIERQEHVS